MGNRNRKYCSKSCSTIYYKQENGFASAFSKQITTGTVGAISELIVATELMKNGYEIYRAISPSSSCDLLGLKGGKLYSFEVRTGYHNKKKDKVSYSKARIKANYVAVVVFDSEKVASVIKFIPTLV